MNLRLRSRFRSPEVSAIDERDELDARSSSLKFVIPAEIASSSHTIETVDSSTSSSKLQSDGENWNQSYTKPRGDGCVPSPKHEYGKETDGQIVNIITARGSDPISYSSDEDLSAPHEEGILKEDRKRPLPTTPDSPSSPSLHLGTQGSPPQSVERNQLHVISGRDVQFSTVTIREYMMEAGDNPATTRGVPLTITWDHHRHYTVALDDYEELHPARRVQNQMRMESLHRLRLLKGVGYSREELQNVIEKVNLDRRRRQRTIEFMRLAPLEEFFERAYRGALNWTIRRGQKRKERAELDLYRSGKVDCSLQVQIERDRRKKAVVSLW